MNPWRNALAAVLITSGVVVGAAASLSLASGTLGTARAATPRCTAAGLSVTQNLSGTSVASVTVGTLPSGCGGATMQVTLNNGAANSSGSAAVPAGGGSVTVTLAAPVPVTAWEQTDLVLVGP
jgi:hypothetical protein